MTDISERERMIPARRRILRKIKIGEISAVDRPAQSGALVAIMKRAEPSPHQRRQVAIAKAGELLAKLRKFNPHHDERGRFSSGPGGASSTPTPTPSSAGNGNGNGTAEIPRAHRDETTRWLQTALRTAKIASWALIVPGMVAAFTASLPVGVTFAIGAALRTLITRRSLGRTAAFFALDTGLTKLIAHREAELAKASSDDDPVLRTLRAMQAELRASKDKHVRDDKTTKFNPNHDPRTGQFSSGPGGAASSASSSSTPAPNVAPAPPAKRSRLKRALLAAGRSAAAALNTLGLVVAVIGPQAMSIALAAAIGLAAERVERARRARAASPAPRPAPAQRRGVDFWMDKSLPPLTEQQARRVLDRLPDLLSDEQADAVLEALERKGDVMDKNASDPAYEELVTAEINGSAMPRHIAQQRLLAKYGSKPDAALLNKRRGSDQPFMHEVDSLIAKGCSRTQAMQRARRDHPDAYRAYQES